MKGKYLIILLSTTQNRALLKLIIYYFHSGYNTEGSSILIMWQLLQRLATVYGTNTNYI